ncbi:MAG: terpene cyclase/mutase family protein, partial [Armatimonadetes bacterium]|nr:terpene cyclase/mutase family protein [Armatimonadota bacterium]
LSGKGTEVAYRKGTAYLAALPQPDGKIKTDLAYPVYTASGAVIILTRDGNPSYRKARDAWLAFLRSYQSVEPLGWKPGDLQYGGWGYSVSLPRKPAPGQPEDPMGDSNLSATLFAVGALRVAGFTPKDPCILKALRFVKQCQNFSDRKPGPGSDGGFFLSPTHLVKNKAGIAGGDKAGHPAIHSYGSATADGLRSLIRCGLPPGDPRIQRARNWLEEHFDPAVNPGHFEKGSATQRDSVYYYYCWSLAHAMLELGQIVQGQENRKWARSLAEELLRRQLPDGSWVNRFTASREDEPLISTPMALSALTICRMMASGDKP